MSKRTTGLIILTVICLLLITSCSDLEIIDVGWSDQDSVQETTESLSREDQIDHILRLVSNRENSLLKNYITAESFNRYGDDQIITRQQEVDKRLGVRQIDLRDISLLDILSDKNIEVYEMVMSLVTDYGPIERPLTLTFILNEKLDRWELEWTPAAIFPGLTANNDIVVEILQAPRGTIYDRSGRELAVDGLKQQVGAVSGVYDMSKHADVAALLDMTKEEVERKMSQSWIRDNMFVPLQIASSYAPDQVAHFSEYGLSVRTIQSRLYPYDDAFAHLIGYVADVTFEGDDDPKHETYRSGDVEGKRGLEAHFEEELRPERGVRVSLTGGNNEVLFERLATAGKDYYLTVDAELQRKIFETVKEYTASTTAIDPISGDILALVSTPSFSPNSMSAGISNHEYQALVNDSRLPLLNRFQLRYPPGSTFKIATSIAAFNSGVLSESTTKTITGSNWQHNSSWGGYYVSRIVVKNEPQDLISAISISDNIFFAQLVTDMGVDVFYDELLNLGLNENVPSEYPFYRSQITNSGEPGTEIMMADTAYGQGQLQITQVHLAAIYASLVNGGNIYEPHVLKGHEGTIWKENICNSENLRLLRKAMRNSVTTTHVNTVNRDYANFAGKSGTVQRGWDEELEEQVIDTWFIGFDNDNPTMILATQLQDMHKREDNASAFSLWGEIMDHIYENGAYQVP